MDNTLVDKCDDDGGGGNLVGGSGCVKTRVGNDNTEGVESEIGENVGDKIGWSFLFLGDRLGGGRLGGGGG